MRVWRFSTPVSLPLCVFGNFYNKKSNLFFKKRFLFWGGDITQDVANVRSADVETRMSGCLSLLLILYSENL